VAEFTIRFTLALSLILGGIDFVGAGIAGHPGLIESSIFTDTPQDDRFSRGGK